MAKARSKGKADEPAKDSPGTGRVSAKKSVAKKAVAKKAVAKKAVAKKAVAKKAVAKKAVAKKVVAKKAAAKKTAAKKTTAKKVAAKKVAAKKTTTRQTPAKKTSPTVSATAAAVAESTARGTAARGTTSTARGATARAASGRGAGTGGPGERASGDRGTTSIGTTSTARQAGQKKATVEAEAKPVLRGLAAKLGRGKAPAMQSIRCYLCGKSFEVSARTMSTTCSHCNKAIKVEDLHIKSYMPVNELQTCGQIKITKRGRIAARTIQSGRGIVCDGSIEGSVEAEGPVELGPKAAWKGTSLQSRTLEVADGATLNGHVSVPWRRTEDPDANR